MITSYRDTLYMYFAQKQCFFTCAKCSKSISEMLINKVFFKEIRDLCIFFTMVFIEISVFQFVFLRLIVGYLR